VWPSGDHEGGKMSYPFGDFSFIKDKLIRETLEYDFKIINNIPGSWDEFREHDLDKSFMYQTYGQIWEKIAQQAFPGHSSASFGMSMRTFEYIAKHGWESYVNKNN
jgi:hypothetical protein